MISRKEAFELLTKYVRDDKLIKHSLAVEAILKAMAKMLHEDEELWGLTGLLHDLDYEYTKEEPAKHATVSSQILDGIIPEEAIKAIKAHNYQYTDHIPTTALDRALIAADAVSGLIIATALIMPSMKLSEVKPETLMNKFKDSSFAKKISRKRIELCEDTGFELDMFFDVSLKALQNISDDLGL